MGRITRLYFPILLKLPLPYVRLCPDMNCEKVLEWLLREVLDDPVIVKHIVQGTG